MKITKQSLVHLPRIIIGLLMLWGSLGMLMGSPMAATQLAQFGLPYWFMAFAGPMTFMGSLCLLQNKFKKLQEYAHVAYMIYFMGAFATHLGVGQPFSTGIPALAFYAITMWSLWRLHLRDLVSQ